VDSATAPAATVEVIVPRELFDRAQAILTERSEDRSQRRSNASDYLLTGRVRCGRCGPAFVGTAAHGRNGRYTYYTCFTRHRYGTEHERSAACRASGGGGHPPAVEGAG
jgi:site-specific DNA recombinase